MQKYGNEQTQEHCLLLVEDQLDLAELVEDALSNEGNTITHAESVFEATQPAAQRAVRRRHP